MQKQKILHKNKRPLKEPVFHKQWPQNQLTYAGVMGKDAEQTENLQEAN